MGLSTLIAEAPKRRNGAIRRLHVPPSAQGGFNESRSLRAIVLEQVRNGINILLAGVPLRKTVTVEVGEG